MAKQALPIVDMQQALFSNPRHDADGLMSRIDALAARLRSSQLPIIFIQHFGQEGDLLHPSQPGHALHAGLSVGPADMIVKKASCDAFLGTELASTLSQLAVDELIVTGCASDVCVDTTIRSALGHGYPPLAPEDGHTTLDRPYLSVQDIIKHHNNIWANFTSPVGPARSTLCNAVS